MLQLGQFTNNDSANLLTSCLTSFMLHLMLLALLITNIDFSQPKPLTKDKIITFELIAIGEIDNVKTETTSLKKSTINQPIVKKVNSNKTQINSNKTQPSEEKSLSKSSNQQESFTHSKIEKQKENGKKIATEKIKNKKLTTKLIDQNFKAKIGKTDSKGGQFNKNKPLSISLKNYIKNIISQYWRKPAGAELTNNIKIIAKIKLSRNGQIEETTIIESVCSNIQQKSLCKLVENSIYRTMKQIDVIENLPAARYDEWREFTLIFDPGNF